VGQGFTVHHTQPEQQQQQQQAPVCQHEDIYMALYSAPWMLGCRALRDADGAGAWRGVLAHWKASRHRPLRSVCLCFAHPCTRSYTATGTSAYSDVQAQCTVAG
jgi:hypothetical protein